jgi:hypothetical protein
MGKSVRIDRSGSGPTPTSGPEEIRKPKKSGGGGSPVLAIILVCLVLIAVCAGGVAVLKRATGRPDPRETVEKYIAGLQANGGKGMMALLDQTPNDPRAQGFRQYVRAMFPDYDKTVADVVNKVKVDVGNAKVEGDKATVPIDVSLAGTTGVQLSDVNLSWKGGQWTVTDEDNPYQLRRAVFQYVMQTPMGQQIMHDMLNRFASGGFGGMGGGGGRHRFGGRRGLGGGVPGGGGPGGGGPGGGEGGGGDNGQ